MSGTSRIKQLFHAVADAADPAAALREQTDATPEEAARVLRLLGHATEPTRFSAPLAQAAEALQAPELSPGDRLGPWRLGQPLGEGGMGLVFEAERDDGHYRQRAALKLLRGWSGQEGLARLARERQILASLSHPHIARLLDGGSTPAGRPYLVMEFIDGQPIDAHADAQALGLDARLQLFDAVCDAVAHAHAQLVIHCDIKPGNVLVDRGGQVKLLDFGIAQLAGQGDDAGFSPAATPGYAPPEQLAGERPTPAWDVFALGRLLQRLTGAQAGRRAAELQAVVARACADDPAARYPGVPALREELHRLRRHEPLVALRGSSPLYPLAKALRRRWPWALTGLLVLSGSAAFTQQLVVERDSARTAQAHAQQQAATAREVNQFLVDLFSGADAFNQARATELRAIDLVDRGEQRLRTQLADRPLQRAQLLDTLGKVTENLGQTARAVQLYRESIAAYGQAGITAPLPPIYNALAFCLNRLGRYREALRVIEAWDALDMPESERISNLDNAYGTVLANLGRVDEARAAMLRALAGLGESPERPVGRLTNRARIYYANLGLAELAGGRPQAAEAALRRAIEGETQPSRYLRLPRLGLALLAQGRLPEALQAMQEADALVVKQFGELTGNRHRVLRDMGWAQLQAGQTAAAAATLRLALRCAQEGGEAGHPLAAMTLSRLAQALAATGDRAGALQAHDEALRLALAHEADGDPVGLAQIRAARDAFLSRQP
jgi:serine/threonine-protein kinase